MFQNDEAMMAVPALVDPAAVGSAWDMTECHPTLAKLAATLGTDASGSLCSCTS